MDSRVISLLDRPTYTYPQVDRLLALTKGTAQRWLNGYRSSGKRYDPVQRMRRAIEVLREEIDADYPLEIALHRQVDDGRDSAGSRVPTVEPDFSSSAGAR